MFVVRIDGLGLDVVLMNLGLNLQVDLVRLVCSLLLQDLAELLVEEHLVVVIEALRLAVELQWIS